MQRIRIERDGHEIEVIVEKIQGRLWYHLDGETHVYVPATLNKAAAAAVNPGRVEAPMPGKVLRVEVQLGEKVTAGKVLVVMEAMKMEYTLASAIDGTVESIGCRPGEQVRLGQMLVGLKGEARV